MVFVNIYENVRRTRIKLNMSYIRTTKKTKTKLWNIFCFYYLDKYWGGSVLYVVYMYVTFSIGKRKLIRFLFSRQIKTASIEPLKFLQSTKKKERKENQYNSDNVGMLLVCPKFYTRHIDIFQHRCQSKANRKKNGEQVTR